MPGGGPTAASSDAPHWRQNVAGGLYAVPQAPQAATEGAVVGPGSGADGAESRGAPHPGQNFAPIVTAAPQLEQTDEAGSAPPQPRQNREFSEFPTPHAGQIRRPLADDSEPKSWPRTFSTCTVELPVRRCKAETKGAVAPAMAPVGTIYVRISRKVLVYYAYRHYRYSSLGWFCGRQAVSARRQYARRIDTCSLFFWGWALSRAWC